LATAQTPAHSSNRAWIITGLVIGADVLLAARWYAGRSRLRKKSAANRPQGLPDAGLPSVL
jgi:hypothetical protein